MENAQVNADANQSLVNELLAGLGNPQPDEIIEQAQPVTTVTEGADEIIEQAGPTLTDEQIDAMLNQPSAAPETQAGPTITVTGDKPKKKKKEKKPKAEAAPKEPAKPKEPKPKRITFVGNAKSVVLDARLGGKSADFLVLETSDLTLSDEDLKTKQEALKDELDNKIAKKVSEKCIMLMRDVAGGGKVGNEVMRRTFEVLARDGFLTSGDKGNLQVNLSEKYSLGTARSQANQMFMLLPFLKITVKGKGRMDPNPDSTILASVNAAHGLTIKAAE